MNKNVLGHYKHKLQHYERLSKFLSIFGLNDTFQNKISKYKDRIKSLEEQRYSLDIFNQNISKMNHENRKLGLSGKIKVIIIGSLNSNTEEDLYTNILLKNLDYRNSIVHLYERNTNALIEYNNEEYLQNFSYRNIRYYSMLDMMDLSCYDICIYVSDLKDRIILPFAMSSISYLYCYNSACINDKNIKPVDRNFDAIITPDEDISKCLCDSYLNKIILPLSFDMYFYERLEKNTKTGNITCIAYPQEILELVKEFSKLSTLLKSSNITINALYIPKDVTLNFDYPYETDTVVKEILEYSGTNIKVTKVDTLQFFCEIKKYAAYSDAFIFTDKFENFINNPKLLSAAGKVVFIPEKYKTADNITGIFKYKNYGNLAEQIKEYIENKTFYDDKYSDRVEYAKKYSQFNEQYYYNIINGNNIIKSDITECKDGNIYLSEDNLYLKYQKYIKHKEFKAPQKLTVIPANAAGFFSVYNKHVSYLAYKEDDECIIPDWRISQLNKNIYRYWHSDIIVSFCYGKYNDGNIFFKLFENPYNEEVIAPDLYQSDIMYDYANKVIDCPVYNFDNEPFLTYIYSYELPNNKEYYREFREKYHNIVEKYMVPLPYIREQIGSFKKQYMENYFCIAVHVRCLAHSSELFEKTQFENYTKKIAEILNQNNIDIKSDGWKLFVATDNELALEYFKNLYPKNTIFQEGISRLTVEQENEYNDIKKKENRDVYGFELQQRNSETDETRNLKFAVDILTDTYLLSACKYFIYQNSNVSTAVSYLNPNIEMVYCK